MNQFEIYGAIASFIGFGGLIVLGGLFWKLADRLRSLESEATSAKDKALEANGTAQRAQAELNAFKLESVKTFVSNETLQEMEKRLIDAITRLGDRFDKFLDQNNRRDRP